MRPKGDTGLEINRTVCFYSLSINETRRNEIIERLSLYIYIRDIIDFQETFSRDFPRVFQTLFAILLLAEHSLTTNESWTFRLFFLDG